MSLICMLRFKNLNFYVPFKEYFLLASCWYFFLVWLQNDVFFMHCSTVPVDRCMDSNVMPYDFYFFPLKAEINSMKNLFHVCLCDFSCRSILKYDVYLSCWDSWACLLGLAWLMPWASWDSVANTTVAFNM